jgi:hypothetical protein
MYFYYSHPLPPVILSFLPPSTWWFPSQQSPFIIISYYFKGLYSVYEGKHVIFVFLSLVYLVNIMISSSTHFPANDIISFFMVEWYSTVHMHCLFFFHSLVDGHLSRLHSLSFVTSVVINMVCRFSFTWTSYHHLFVFFFLAALGLELRASHLLGLLGRWSITCATLFVLGFFKIGIHELLASGWLWTTVLPISASWVARITGVCHQHPDCCLFSWWLSFWWGKMQS